MTSRKLRELGQGPRELIHGHGRGMEWSEEACWKLGAVQREEARASERGESSKSNGDGEHKHTDTQTEFQVGGRQK